MKGTTQGIFLHFIPVRAIIPCANQLYLSVALICQSIKFTVSHKPRSFKIINFL